MSVSLCMEPGAAMSPNRFHSGDCLFEEYHNLNMMIDHNPLHGLVFPNENTFCILHNIFF